MVECSLVYMMLIMIRFLVVVEFIIMGVGGLVVVMVFILMVFGFYIFGIIFGIYNIEVE